MIGPLVDRGLAGIRRARRLERRRLRAFRRWVEQTSNLLHLSVLLFVPLLIGGVTALANAVASLSFLLFPPLAAGTYMLFSDPERKRASPVRFVAGLTAGAVCGRVALALPVHGGGADGVAIATGSVGVDAVAAGTAVLLTGAVTWAFDIEEASAYSTALLALLVPDGDVLAFVGSVVVASAIVATVFSLWRTHVYEQRARLLYESTDGGDRIIVPMRGENPEETAMLAARLAAAQEAGKVVLLDFVADEAIERRKRRILDGRSRDSDGVTVEESAVEKPERAVDLAEQRVATEAAERLAAQADTIESRVGVRCQTVAATGRSMAATVRRVAHETDCDLIAASYEERHGGLSPDVLELFECEMDVLVHRSAEGRTDWSDVLVPVRGPSDLAHRMLGLGARLAAETGQLSTATCVESDRARRRAEGMLANLVETVGRVVETRVSTAPVETFLERTAGSFDLLIMGASMDRSGASRFLSQPTFERLEDLETDTIIVDRP